MHSTCIVGDYLVNIFKNLKKEKKSKGFLSFKHDQELATDKLNIPKINTIIICKIN